MYSPQTISEASKLLAAKKLSAVALATGHLDRIDRLNPELNAFLYVDKQGALAAAQASDKRRAEGKSLGPLDGIPISIKDVIVTKGMPTTAGAKMLEGFESPYDATVVRRLKDAGAVILGKTNCDAWAHGTSTENSAYGPTKNPWDTSRVPGGSSGGSAAAVAAGMGLASIGTDTGGSIRQPASLSGVTGLKPTYGRASRYGLIAMASSLDCPGPITRSAEDAALILSIIAGRDPHDATSLPSETINYQLSTINLPLKGKKIGLPKEYFGEGLDAEVERVIRQALAVYQQLGAELVEISLPMTEYALAAYYIICPAEVSSNLARYDGIRYGHRSAEATSLREIYDKSRAEGFGPEAKRRIMIGTYVLSSGYYDAYYRRAMQVRTKVVDEFAQAFESVDLIAGPVSPTAAFKIGEKADDPLALYLLDVYTVTANLAGIPGISIPCGFLDEKKGVRSKKQGDESHTPNSALHPPRLPVGLQLLGPQLGEDVILQAAMAFQRETDFHLQDPPLSWTD
ncbi:Asp-tRNA(Asn)/Glu-tRNA(Gln) amidotransferase subunit GatA [Candidatus Berkelbacteria bacterium]|nr:Asp-tRNA(Asn)/Glu-tRNA(Gln) amidotransferase subunit GatA [Candidatus Berkelbacteria bacterium]